MAKDKKKATSIKIDPALLKDFKVYCAKKGVTVSIHRLKSGALWIENMENKKAKDEEIRRDYFCNFCYPDCGDGSEADEKATYQGKEKSEEYTGQELCNHYLKKHKAEIVESFIEDFQKEHFRQVNGWDTWTGKKIPPVSSPTLKSGVSTGAD